MSMEKPQQNEYRKDLSGKLKGLRELDKDAGSDLANQYLDKVSAIDDYKTNKEETRSNFKSYKYNQDQAKIEELRNQIKGTNEPDVVPGDISENESTKENKVDIDVYINEKFPGAFEVNKNESGLELILKDQMQFEKWFETLAYLKDKVKNAVTLYDPENDDSIQIKIKNPMISAQGDQNQFNVRARFDKDDIDQGLWERIQRNKDTMGTAHIMSIVKTEAVDFHPGMLKSVEVK